jgi:hypothetical protein
VVGEWKSETEGGEQRLANRVTLLLTLLENRLSPFGVMRKV